VTGRQLISRIVHLRNKPEEKKRKNLNKNPHQGGAGSRTHQTIVPSANLLADLKKKKRNGQWRMSSSFPRKDANNAFACLIRGKFEKETKTKEDGEREKKGTWCGRHRMSD
jgi:hypothetical protein